LEKRATSSLSIPQLVKQIWDHPVEGNPTNGGFNYWESKDRSDRRLIFAANGYLQEVNVKTGVTIPSFGNDGRVNLREGLGATRRPSERFGAARPAASSRI
jgi:quinoprotein glucose dehydrogenase